MYDNRSSRGSGYPERIRGGSRTLPGSGGRGMNGRGMSSRRKRGWLSALPWILVLVNVLLLVRLYGQIDDIRESVGLIWNRLGALEAGREYQNEDYQSAPEETSVSQVVLSDYAAQWGLEEVERPRERDAREILERLGELSGESELIDKVLQNSREYPERLLEALANNPEMADFAVHYPEKKGTVTREGLTEAEKEADFPLFLQWDPRWGYASYGDDSVVGLSGCGPTALSMALFYLTEDETLTPDKLAQYSMNNGYYISGTGTAWLLMEQVPPVYGVDVEQPEISEETMKRALDRGDVIVCSVGPGDFTVGGHFLVIYGYGDDGFYLNDPNCVARSRSPWSYERLEPQMKHIWVMGRS